MIMNLFVAHSADRYDIEPILRGIALMMVIMLGLFVALYATELGGFQQSACINSAMDGFFCFAPVGIFLVVFIIGTFACFFTRRTKSIFAALSLSIFCLAICKHLFAIILFPLFCITITVYRFSMAGLTLICISIALRRVCKILYYRFDLFAVRTLLRYDYIRHILSFTKSMLGSIKGYIPSIDLFILGENRLCVN